MLIYLFGLVGNVRKKEDTSIDTIKSITLYSKLNSFDNT